MNIQEMVAALRCCASMDCAVCPLEGEDSACATRLLEITVNAVEAMAAELEKLRKPDVPHPSAPLTASPRGSQGAAAGTEEAG